MKVTTISLSIQSSMIHSVTVNIASVNVEPEVIQEIHNVRSTGVYVSSETLERRFFPKPAGSNCIETNADIALSNTTSITVILSKKSNDCTVLENVVCNNVSLSVNKHQFSDT